MKHIGIIIKQLREKKGITQTQIAELINMHRSNYSRVESGDRDLSIDAIKKLAEYFNMTIDDIVNFDDSKTPKEITIENKTLTEKIKLIDELSKEEQSMVFKMIDSFLTKKKFKDFFNKNLSCL